MFLQKVKQEGLDFISLSQAMRRSNSPCLVTGAIKQKNRALRSRRPFFCFGSARIRSHARTEQCAHLPLPRTVRFGLCLPWRPKPLLGRCNGAVHAAGAPQQQRGSMQARLTTPQITPSPPPPPPGPPLHHKVLGPPPAPPPLTKQPSQHSPMPCLS